MNRYLAMTAAEPMRILRTWTIDASSDTAARVLFFAALQLDEGWAAAQLSREDKIFKVSIRITRKE